MFRLIGVELGGSTLMQGNNLSLVLNASISSNALKKKHSAIAYDRVLV
jgi:hypothetical protein